MSNEACICDMRSVCGACTEKDNIENKIRLQSIPKSIEMTNEPLRITLEFSGGAENLFDHIKSRELELDSNKTKTIGDLLVWIKENILRERPELFLQDDTVRPGILVLINETDWELLGESNYEIKQNDNILFISTLHGG